MNKQNFRREAHTYALGVTIEPTDTLLAIIEDAYLAGMARDSLFEQPPVATFVGPDVTLLDDGEPLLRVMHRNGTAACHRVALYHRGRVDPSVKADLSKLRTYPARTIPTPHDVPRCGSCGQNIDPYTTQDLDWREHLAPLPVPPDLLPNSPPSGPGADSPRMSGESTGRTPVEDTASLDVQHSDQPEPETLLPAADAGDQLSKLHSLATTMFDARPTREPTSWPAANTTENPAGNPDAVPPVE